jgi:hypothetical protein
MRPCDPRAGARTLIEDAIRARPGETLAIVAEDPRLGFYDSGVAVCIADVAREMGIAARIVPVGDEAGLDAIPPTVAEALATADHVLFQARLGDTLRFSAIPGRATKTMSYALDLGILGGPSCTVPFAALEEVRAAYDARANRARHWRVTCPLGTDLSGTQDVAAVAAGRAPDFTMRRFPVSASRPISCATANGVVVLARWLISSGNRRYEAPDLVLPEPVRAHVEDGHVTRFEGPPSLVADLDAHYRRVGRLFGIDTFAVHSWHAGINPGCFYPMRAEAGLERWGMVVFASPRYLHFHTCGNYAPGEICWSVIDASADLDGVPFWRDGACVFLDSPEVGAILARRGLAALDRRTDIGVA